MIEGLLWIFGFIFLMSDSSAGAFCSKHEYKNISYYKCSNRLQIPVLKAIKCPDNDKEHSCGILNDMQERMTPSSITISM